MEKMWNSCRKHLCVHVHGHFVSGWVFCPCPNIFVLPKVEIIQNVRMRACAPRVLSYRSTVLQEEEHSSSVVADQGISCEMRLPASLRSGGKKVTLSARRGGSGCPGLIWESLSCICMWINPRSRYISRLIQQHWGHLLPFHMRERQRRQETQHPRTSGQKD